MYVVHIFSTVTVVVLVVLYRKRMGKFQVEKSHQAHVEVDNDLYGFTRQHEDLNVTDGGSGTNKLQNYEYDEQAINPLYKSGHRDVQANYTLYGESQTAGTETADTVYSNIDTDTRKIQLNTDDEYSYCKH